MSLLSVQSNILANTARRNAKKDGVAGARSAQRLASGYRINSAADDAAGLAISEKMRAQIRGLNQAERNIQDGTSLLQVADGALQEAQNIVHRMRELAVQSCNDTNNDDDRMKLDAEYKQLCEELESIAQDTEFNKKKLFTGEYAERIFTGLEKAWAGVTESEFPNNASSAKPSIDPSYSQSASSADKPSISGDEVPSFPPYDAPELTDMSRPARDSNGDGDLVDANDLSGSHEYSSGTVSGIDNKGGKIAAYDGTDELNVGNNTSYKNNMDGSYYLYKGQGRDLIAPGYWDSNNVWIEAKWGEPYEVTAKVYTLENHSEDGNPGSRTHSGLPAGQGNAYYDTDTWTFIGEEQPAGNTLDDYDRDEWERAEIYSEAKKTTVANNEGGMVFVRNDDDAAVTHVTNNNANANYNFDFYEYSIQSPQGETLYRGYLSQAAIVDTNTRSVTVGENSYSAVVVSRNHEAGSKFNSTTNSGTIYCGAEETVVGENRSNLFVNVEADDLSKSAASKTTVTTNGSSSNLYTNSHAVEIGNNLMQDHGNGYISYGYIVHLNSDAGSSFDLTGTNSGQVKTDAQLINVNSNTGNLITTTASAELKVDTNTGKIVTKAETVDIETNDGPLFIENSAAAADINATGINSIIDTSAAALTIHGDAYGNINGDITVSSGTVVFDGTNNAHVSLNGGTLHVTGDLGGTMEVASNAALVIDGNVTGTLYVKQGADVTISPPGELKGPGKIIFLGEPDVFYPNPFNVAAGSEVEFQSTKNVGIKENNGTVKMLDSAVSIEDNKGDLQVYGNLSVATVSANSGTILNLGTIVPNGSANMGVIDNWGKITPLFTNADGRINHYAPFVTEDGTYDASDVNFPNVVEGELSPAVQTSTIKISYNGQDYTLTANWQPTSARMNGDVEGLCDCTVGVHNRNECTDLLGMVADAFELKFDLDSITSVLPDGALQDGEQFIFMPNARLNADGMRYDIAGRTITYDVDQWAFIKEMWDEGTGIWLQTGANAGQGHSVYLPKLTEGMGETTTGCVFCDCGTLKSADLLNVPNATGALDICDMANSNISEVRGYVGAQINRLTYTGNSVAVSSENFSSAESRIRDADMGKETMNTAKMAILNNASMAMIAQANQNSQAVLQLLRQ